MANIISRRVTKFVKEYSLHFQKKGAQTFRGSGFPCDEQGNVLPTYNRYYLDALAAVGTEYDPPYVHTYEVKHTEPGVLKCDCGQRVSLWGFTNTCECGADYNMSGSRLAPRSQWGEETGESASDILNYDYEGGADVEY